MRCWPEDGRREQHSPRNSNQILPVGRQSAGEYTSRRRRGDIMANSILEQYRIADFLQWFKEKALIPNPYFQRGAVWVPAARVFFVDTILRRLPIPKIYIRTTLDLRTKKSVREIVDGQQRLRTIIDFSEDRLTLTKRAGDFAGLKYSTLSDEQKETFLTYAIGVEQLINASDADVLEIFSRLNSYNVMLNAAEQRHAEFQGDFKWAIHRAARDWDALWEKYEIVTTRERVRMLHDSFMAEMFGIVLEGVTDGGQARIYRLYRKYNDEFARERETRDKIDRVCNFITTNLDDVLLQPPGNLLCNQPHFLMLFAAAAHGLVGIPVGQITGDMPRIDPSFFADPGQTRENLRTIAQLINLEVDALGLADFVLASRATTQRIASRRIRFPVYCRAFLPAPLIP